MPTPIKVPLDELHILLGKGLTITAIARRFNVSPAAISYARKKIRKGVIRASVVQAHKLTSKQVDIVSRLQRSLDEFDCDLQRSLDLLEQAVTVGEKATVLKLKSEIMDRQGKAINRILDATRTLADFKIMSEFMAQVLETIEKVNPDERKRIVYALEQVCGAAIRPFIRHSEEISERVSDPGSGDEDSGCDDGSGPGRSAEDISGDA